MCHSYSQNIHVHIIFIYASNTYYYYIYSYICRFFVFFDWIHGTLTEPQPKGYGEIDSTAIAESDKGIIVDEVSTTKTVTKEAAAPTTPKRGRSVKA